jgi:excisionase family DNA binding protein
VLVVLGIIYLYHTHVKAQLFRERRRRIGAIGTEFKEGRCDMTKEEKQQKRKIYLAENKEEIKRKRKIYLAANKELIAVSRHEYWLKNRDRTLAGRRAKNATLTEEEKQEIRERQKVYSKRYQEKDPERYKAKNKRSNAKPRRKDKMARWHQENKDRRREQQEVTRPALMTHYREVKQNNGLLTGAQAAPLLGISSRTLSTWLQLGKIPHVKSGNRYYIKQDTIDAFKNTLATGEITVMQLGRRLSRNAESFSQFFPRHRHGQT